MPTLDEVRTVHANDATNDAATLTVLLDYLQHIEDRLAVLENREPDEAPA